VLAVFFAAGLTFLAAGAMAGLASALTDTPWLHWPALHLAFLGGVSQLVLALNLAGRLGTAIVGTLHTFFPSLTQTRLRLPRLQAPTFVAWLFGSVRSRWEVPSTSSCSWSRDGWPSSRRQGC
jgi:hypothetical protein